MIRNEGCQHRQAVVLIHGIGEQRPLDTLRTFVKGVCGDKPYRSKPDKLSALFELRRLQLPRQRREQPLTDFYEYYWAHHMRDTRARMLISWMRNILFRKPNLIPSKLVPLFLLGWMGIAIPLAIIGHALLANAAGSDVLLLGWAFGVMAIDVFFFNVLYGYIGDAARYLNPHPDNVSQRNKIRQEGIDLLRALHQSKKYSRIVVVGHSLGSVIGYDLLRLYWSTLEIPEAVPRRLQTSAANFNAVIEKLDQDVKRSTLHSTDIFQQEQHTLWHELRSIGWQWLITDFITLGSPLAHSELLLADGPADFKKRKLDGEYVTCPPIRGNGDLGESIFYRKTVSAQGMPGKLTSVMVPSHSSPFCCTRWTNLYVPHSAFFFGDFVGGPLAPVLGKGILDRPVQCGDGLARLWLSHTRYWDTTTGRCQEKAISSLDTLKNALRLDYLRSSKKWPLP